MTRVYVSTFNNDGQGGTGMYLKENNTTIDDFMKTDIQSIYDLYVRKNAETVCFFLDNPDLTKTYCFILSENNKFIKSNDLPLPTPKKTQDLFNIDYSKITMENLSQSMNNYQADFDMEVEGKNYSCRLAEGFKAKLLHTKVNGYYDDLEKKYSSNKTNKVKP